MRARSGRRPLAGLLGRFGADLADLRQLVEKEFVYSVIFRDVHSHFDVRRFVQLLKIVHLPDVAMVIQVDSRPEDERDEVLLGARRKQVWHLLDVLIHEENDGLVAILGSNNINHAMVEERDVVVLLPVRAGRGAPKATAKDYARFLKSYLEHHLPFTVSVGIGDHYAQLRHLHRSYREARQALEYKFYAGNGVVLHFDDVRTSARKSSAFFVEKENLLVDRMLRCEWDELLDDMERLFLQIRRERCVDPDVLRVRLLEMFTVMSRAAMDMGVDSGPLLDFKVRLGEEIELVATLEEMSSWARDAAQEIVALVQEKQQDGATRAVTRAKQYIRENFRKGLSLEDVALHCFLSPSYFSHVFREATGSSFTSYLKRVRIEKAQHLLLTTDKGVGQVAREVGYSDPNYFSRVFRSVVGKSPNDFRTGKTGKDRATGSGSVQR